MRTKLKSDVFLPLEFVFNPNWWYQNAGISFDENFYFDPETREKNDVVMRRVLFEKLGKYGFGEENPQPRPVAGSLHVAGGFIIPSVLGADILFSKDAAPQPYPKPMSQEEIVSFQTPDPESNDLITRLVSGWKQQRKKYGYLIGDLNTDGLLNAAYHFYSDRLFSDLLENPDIPVKFMNQIADVMLAVAKLVHQHTGSWSIAVNRTAAHLTPTPFVHANCSVQMISPRLYARHILPIEQRMAIQVQPYGIHHCGIGMERYAPHYAKIPVSYCDVGWDSDPLLCRNALPDAFLSLRLNPVRLLRESVAEAETDLKTLLGPLDSLNEVGVCCINMDAGTPQSNLEAICELMAQVRRSKKLK